MIRVNLLPHREEKRKRRQQQFGVLAVDISAGEAAALEAQLRQTMSAAGIAAWVGVGRRLLGQESPGGVLIAEHRRRGQASLGLHP